MNRKKIIGLVFCCAGIICARLDSFFEIEKEFFFATKTIGIFTAFAGLVFFGSGLKKVTKKVKACPACFTKNETSEAICKKCKKPLSAS